MAAQRDWSTPENRIKKQNAFKLYAAGRTITQVMKALGVTSPPTVKKFIHSEKWDKHKELWNASPLEELLYPWEVEHVTTLSLPVENMESMDRNKRLQCVKAFAMYCSGRSVSDVALEIGVSHSTIDLWKDAQRWNACRARLVNENAPAPWEDSGVPTLISDITASLEAMKKSIKFLTGRVLVKAADAAQDLDGMEALGMMRNIKQLAEAASINFSDGNNQQNAIQINIASKLESIKIPNNTTFEAELLVNE